MSKIKLSGFKSFVDPTSILLPSNLVGIVGPNGCGKSNVIDAIRWVMGESSAKNLRGDSMADVIFNGSANRKPVGAASIELYFDNADGAIGGQFARYGEVSVRRTVSRDGQSQYFLNNVRCRRKDITGIFLGTGLGPRSYSIIEQGMISRLIEAKPEDMRAHLEEAAGISKYKERRRETENRIRHTRDNLDRLNDLREEVDNQIRHLEKQARAAERHKVLKVEQRQFEGELLAINLQTLDSETQNERMDFERKQTALESAIASQRKIEADIEQARQAQILSSDEVNATTARHYSVDLEISHLEQAIEHNRATRERQKLDLEEANRLLNDISSEIDDDEAQLKQLETQLAELTPGLDGIRMTMEASSAKQVQCEAELAHWQENWNAFSDELNEARRTAEVEHARIEHLQTQQAQLQGRRESLESERGTISLDAVEEELAAQVRIETELSEKEQEVNRHLQEADAGLASQREQEQAFVSELDNARGELDSSRARLTALETLQQAALGGDEDKSVKWLAENNLNSHPRLAQKMKVAGPWQLAVEAVLGDFLQAVSVDQFDSYLNHLPDSNVLLFQDDPLKYAEEAQQGCLLAQVSNAGPAAEMLARVYTADSLNEALQLRSKLGAGESVITPNGVWVSRTWVRVSRRDAENSGLLSREQEIREVEVSIRSLEKQVERLTEQRDSARTEIERFEAMRKQLQVTQSVAGKEHASAAASLANLRDTLEKSRQRALALGEDSQSIEDEISGVEQSVRDSHSRLSGAKDKSSQLIERETGLKAQQQELLEAIEVIRQEAEADREHYQSMTIEVQSQRSSRDSATTTLERALAQRQQLNERVVTLNGHLQQGSEPLNELQEKLQEQLSLKVAVDNELRNKHESLERVNNELRTHESRRSEQDKLVTNARELVDSHRMVVRELEIRREGIAERFAETGLDLDSVQKDLPEECGVDEWQAKLDKVYRRLDRIGTVNLLAIEEFDEQSERAKYLAEQYEDLTGALETLEKAIRKIDRETRARFQEVFENVNAGLKRIFPRLFGGGHAYMSMEGDDPLNAGVTVMAQPPGKRNSSIHLLSGGEKALTAVALVFSIFELNPAPFCLLDEVDAPLDDANVARFCEIVREMSANVQFMFITHNKVTMELAGQLMGVTMSEPGVSRLVSVDIDEAVELVG
ncbi:MAG: chromosome segregation protein SMC [Gammaproteobacteria bacterium]|nr:chromosome segregation protein SMC [Gammaproteobacteria bacterium]